MHLVQYDILWPTYDFLYTSNRMVSSAINDKFDEWYLENLAP